MTPEQEQEQQALQMQQAQQSASDKSFLINAMMEELAVQRDSALTQLAKEKATTRLKDAQIERLQQQLAGIMEQNLGRGQALTQVGERVVQLEKERDELQSQLSESAAEIERMRVYAPTAGVSHESPPADEDDGDEPKPRDAQSKRRK